MIEPVEKVGSQFAGQARAIVSGPLLKTGYFFKGSVVLPIKAFVSCLIRPVERVLRRGLRSRTR